jgi:hypothetical protein
MYQIQQFDPLKAQKNRVWLLIGGRNTGKSVLLLDLLYKTQRETDFVLAMSATISSIEMFKAILPPGCVYTDGYDYDKADQFLALTSQLSMNGKKRNVTLCLDDVMFDSKVMKCKTQSNLHLNGRHYNTCVFNTTQYSMLIPTAIRSNVDYVFALKETVRANRRRLFEHYFGTFTTFAEFEKVFSECTREYGALVLDRTQSSGNTEDLIKYYKADVDIPKFQLGLPVFYKMAGVIKEMLKKKRKHVNTITIE